MVVISMSINARVSRVLIFERKSWRRGELFIGRVGYFSGLRSFSE